MGMHEARHELLDGTTILVAGGTGNVGSVLVDAFLRAGARVAVPSRSEEKLAALRDRAPADTGERLLGLHGDIAHEDDGPRLAGKTLDQVGHLDAAVAALGRFLPVPSLLEADPGALRQVLDDYLMAHFSVARTVIPHLKRRGSSYTFIQGPLAFRRMSPEASLVSVATAAQAMLAEAVMAETEDRPLRVNEVVLYTGFGWGEEGETRAPVPQPEVARFMVELISARGGEVAGERIHLDSMERFGLLGPA